MRLRRSLGISAFALALCVADLAYGQAGRAGFDRVQLFERSDREAPAGASLIRFAPMVGDARGVGVLEGRFQAVAFPLPDGGEVDLTLQRFRVTTPETRFVVGSVDGPDRPLAFDPESIAFFRGKVVGVDGSQVFLSISESGVVGRVSMGLGAPTYHLTTTGAGSESLGPDEVLIFEGSAPMPDLPASVCGLDTSGAKVPVTEGTPIPGLKQIEVAVETDYEYYVLFNDLNAAATYVTQVYAQISDIYIRDVNTEVDVVFVRLWDDPNDLFNDPDPLGPFRNYWNDNMQAVDRDVAQFFTGRRNLAAGGVAYLNGLCNNNSYSWAGYIIGFFATLDRPHVFNRDVTVTAHELGHNCGTPHTHDLGLDTCDDPNTTPARGPIMSYCGQTFTGGAANTDVRFHAFVQQVMEGYITSRGCIADDCNRNGVADEDDLTAGTSVDVNGNGVPDECEDCNGNMILDDEDIASGTSLDLNGNGIPDECEPDCNGNSVPDDLDLVPSIGQVAFFDSFEVNTGWTFENLGATSGDWEIGVPVNDPGWQYDPESDSDGIGGCLLTANAPGNTDVDAGAVRATSPELGMSGGQAVFFNYYLFLTNENGTDRILVEASDGGQWVEVLVLDTNGGLDWRPALIPESAFQAAGIAQTGATRLRFTINDGDPQSVVEGGIDAVVVAQYVPPVSEDLNNNNIPDECEPDCNGNGILDYVEIQQDMSRDVNRNAILDECEDCDGDEVIDLVELAGAHDVWVGHLESDIKSYDGLTGVEVVSSDTGAITQTIDLVIDQGDGRIFVSTESRVAEFNRQGQYLGDFVASTSGGLTIAGGMAFMPSGNLLVASAGSNEILEYDGQTGAFVGEFVSAGSGGLAGPFGLHFDPRPGGQGNLFVTTADERVLEFDGSSGAFVREFVSAGSGGLTLARGLMFNPVTGNLLVASFETDQVLEYDGQTGAFIGQWNNGGTNNRLTMDNPYQIRLGRDGDVYVSRNNEHESAGGTGALHLTNASIYHFRAENGYFMRAYVLGINAGLHHPTSFDFYPGDDTDCNFNRVPDECDINSGFSQDVNGNGIPDECESVVCYADCDGSGARDIFDFLCFQDAFVQMDPYANCDGNSVFDIFDFLCFQDAFVTGCP